MLKNHAASYQSRQGSNAARHKKRLGGLDSVQNRTVAVFLLCSLFQHAAFAPTFEIEESQGEGPVHMKRSSRISDPVMDNVFANSFRATISGAVASTEVSSPQVSVSDLFGAKRIFVEVALKTSVGYNLGHSLAAAGNILSLGYGGHFLISAEAQLGGLFYTVEDSLFHQTIEEQQHLVSTATSEDMACGHTYDKVQCVALNKTGLPSAKVWVVAPELSSRNERWCAEENGGECFGTSLAVWHRTVAVKGSLTGGSTYVRVEELQDKERGKEPPQGEGEVWWTCKSGCGNATIGNASTGDVVGTDPSFASSLALEDSVLAVGVPGAG
eukprot:CAMPEP_0181290654 /NCGR_PEP_ID=MMETSP1101-20121128/1530_1 /TAXON_ID=46948 /ORGANISM="Rhodomonas abbreviata, Strain Caron Lab Isolate" /LENGTH=326 /DNA_ID=CAMNT_0023394955 /DNA_START=141 /DNA_END=1117 /DNA_ORIENTATION=+